MSSNFDNNSLSNNNNNHEPLQSPISSPASPPISSSSSPSSSSEGSSSSSELNPSDALQSPLTGLLNFEGFSLPQISNFGISNIDMPNFSNLPSLPTLRSFNMPNFQQRLPDLANLRTNLSNFENITSNMRNFPNLSYLSQLANVHTSAELQNLFNLFRISRNLPNLPNLPNLSNLQPFFSAGQFTRNQLLKSWNRLRDSVRNMHLRLNDITQRFPNNFHFREWQTSNGDECIRIYFQLSDFIYYCDSPINRQHQTTSINNNNINLQQPLPSTSTSPGNHQKHVHPSSVNGRFNRHDITHNTKPLQPYNMIVGNFAHIETFEYNPKSSRFVFAIGMNIFYFDDHPEKNECPHVPIKIDTTCSQTKNDLRVCPSNPDLVAYYCNGDIWCVNLKTSQEVRLTDVAEINMMYINNRNFSDQNTNVYNNNNSINDINSSRNNNYIDSSNNSNVDNNNFEAMPFLVGRPSHVIREEFRRHQAYWWRPETEYHVVNDSDDFSEYQLLYEVTDQSQVELVTIPSWDGNIEEQRFPKAGKQNPICEFKIVKFKLTLKDMKIYDKVTIDVKPNFKEIFPSYEYLIRAGWLGQEAIWCQLLNRRQTHLVIAIISLSGSFESQIIYEEKNDNFWVGAHDILYFLNATKIDCQPLVEGSELTFIWCSEETGFRHLYLIKILLGTRLLPAQVVLKKQLTEGSWEVNEKDFWIDEEEMLIYFCGLRDTPLEKQLYTLSYADCIVERIHNSRGKTKIHRLTELNYTQSNIAFNANCSIFINIQSNISVPPFGFVNSIVPPTKFRRDSRRLPDSKRLALLLVNSFNYPIFETSHLDYLKSIGSRPSIIYDCQADLLPGLSKPELFCCQLTNGELIYGSVFKPEFMESGVRYPTVLEIYGGPEIQLVSNNFMNLRQPTRHLLSSEGYVVVLIDCRGSGRRGLTFEAYTHRRMGQLEISDQIEVLKWLAKNTGYIDLDRVAVMGWSYGGYLALMALAQYPETFKIAISGAPVTNWQSYDTAYTERFMGTPNDNPEGYYKGNVINYVHSFPDQENRLLLLHGLKDENVHFTHTASLIKALIEAGKPYDLQIFPIERHILKNPMSCETYMTYVLSYLQLNL